MIRPNPLSRSTRWALCGLMALLAACSSSEKPKPAPLAPLTAQIAGRQVWVQRFAAVTFPLQIAVRDGRFHVATDDGTVAALDVQSGRELWRTQIGARIGAGVGSDGRYAAVVTREGQLVVLDGGKEIWRANVGGRVSTAPLVAGERVFVVGVDRVVNAFDVLDGRRLWTLKRPGDALTLAQTGVLAAFQDTLLVGQGPRLLGVDPLKGSVRWEVAVTTPRGTNEVERLADLVGPAQRVGSSFCVHAFQAAVGCVDAERGTLRWSQPLGGTEAVGGDADLVVAADGSDRITARRRSQGDLAWTSEALLNHGLSAPVVLGKALVFGAGDGTLHFLSKDAGQPLLRLPTDSSGVVAPLVVSDTTLLAVTRQGGVYAFRPE